MNLIVDIAIPAVVVLLMVVVGVDLTLNDFRRVVAYPKAVVIGTLGQLALLPLIVLVVIVALDPAPFLVAGMIVLGACPGGAISNLYTYVARANTALSVTLTAVSTLISIVTLPLLTAAGFAVLLGDRVDVDVPVLGTMQQLFFLLLLPVGVGMVLRHRFPDVSEKHGVGLRRLSIVAIVALLGFVVYDQRANFAGSIGTATVAAVLFTGLSMAAGFGTAWIVNLDVADRFTFLTEFSARNLAIATIVAVSVLGRLEFLVFATAFFLTQVPMMLLAIGVFRATRRGGSALA